MARHKSVKKSVFLEEYEKAESTMDLALTLKVCDMTIRNYLKKYGLRPPKESVKKQISLDIYNAYKGRITLPELAKKFSLDLEKTRYHLRKAMMILYSSDKKPKWPRPIILSHIKIVSLLQKEPKAFKNIDRIVEITGLSESCIGMYIHYAKTRLKLN
jgi:hypothetical protein